jgi:tRNA 2-selenouridine synthase
MRPAPRTSVPAEAASLRDCDAIIDTRSPAEFAEDHIPGAISCPVLDNEERARVGTLYKQASPFAAKKLGAALVAKNISRHIEMLFLKEEKNWRPLVYCWRGGKRSGAMTHVLREIGWDAKSLEGGYKAYRRYVVESLSRLPGHLTFRVIHGATGSGKSRVLRALLAAGAQALDLEDLAAHRGSVLGTLPERPQPSQKMFESRLLKALMDFDPAREIFVEGESRKIGQLQVPEALIERMRASECLLLQTGAETRIAMLLDEYRHFFADPAALGNQLDCLAGLHGRDKVGEWKGLAAAGDWRSLVARLLEEHYDAAYRRSAERNFTRLAEARVFHLNSPDEAALERLAHEIAHRGNEAVAA